jgi:hypothetical protein
LGEAISEGAVVSAIKEQVSCEVRGEAVILKVDTGVYYGLNEVGTRVWNLVQRPTAFGDILRTLLEEFDVEPQQCSQDLSELLQEMAAVGLINVGAGRAS